jgi:hypothetical protein
MPDLKDKLEYYLEECQLAWEDNENYDKDEIGLDNMNGIRSTQLAALVRVLIDKGVLK